MTTSVDQPATPTQAVDGNTVFRMRQSPDLDWVEVDGQVVAWTQPNESLHLFDPISSLVFQLMDGETPVDVTVAELAAVFGNRPDEISADVRRCAAELEALGVLERAR